MRLKKRTARFLLGLGGLFVGLLICEIGLRIGGFSQPRFFSMPDRYRGIALRPNAEGWWREEGDAYVRINSAGLRDREHVRRLAQPMAKNEYGQYLLRVLEEEGP
jgi:hypothetical protein